jgi:hypothetical protein
MNPSCNTAQLRALKTLDTKGISWSKIWEFKQPVQTLVRIRGDRLAHPLTPDR